MAKIKLTLPGLEIPVDGKQVSFTAPCSCSAVDGIHIDGVDYDLVDSAGNVVPFGRFVWCEGAVLTVTLDVTNRKAYLQNQNAYTRYEALTPATAELFGLGADAVPDDVFNWLGEYAKHHWKRRTVGGGYSIKLSDKVAASNSSYDSWVINDSLNATNHTVSYATSVAVDSEGNISLVNPSTVTFSRDTYTKASVLAGKYFKKELINSGGVVVSCYAYVVSGAIPSTRIFDQNAYGINGGITFGSYQVGVAMDQQILSSQYNTELGEWELVNSTDETAYPTSGKLSDGYEYLYLGIPFQNAVTAPKIATGSYVGTGKHELANAITLTFDFVPKFVWISAGGVSRSDGYMLTEFLSTAWTSSGYKSNDASGEFVTDGNHCAKLVGTTLSWGSGYSAAQMLNVSGRTYYYIAIG